MVGSMSPKPTTVFRIHTGQCGASYTETTIRIQTFNRIRVAEQIAKGLESPDYYGDPARFQALEKAGHKFYFEPGFGGHDFLLSYLHMEYQGEPGYCAHKIDEIDGGLQGLQWASKLLVKISREIAKSQDRYYGPSENYSFCLNNPAEVVAALKKMKAVEIEFVPCGVNIDTGWSDREAVAKTSGPYPFFEVTA